MKKIIGLLVVIALLASLAPAALAAGSASMTGPSVIRAGDVITVSFSAGGGIYGGSGTVSYDASQLTLQGYSQSVGGSWAVEFNGNNFVFYDNSMASPIDGMTTIFTATFQVNSGVAPGTGVSVSASGVTLSDGQNDMGAGSPTYSVTVAEPLSNNCNLAALNVANASISPAFSVDNTEYYASVPYEVSALSLTAAAEHPGAQVTIGDTYLEEAATTSVKVTVTAETGATKTYVINVSRPRDPNYVESGNCNLADLWVEGFVLSPAFAVDVEKYYVWLPYETETVAIGATTEDSKASLAVDSSVVLEPGKGTDIPVTVTAENGTQRVYTVTAVRAPAPEKVEQYLNCPHEIEPEPTEPPTEPVTEPEPTEPATEATEPLEQLQEPERPAGIAWWVALLTGVLGVAVGAVAGVGALVWYRKQKDATAAMEKILEEATVESPAEEAAEKTDCETQPEATE